MQGSVFLADYPFIVLVLYLSLLFFIIQALITFCIENDNKTQFSLFGNILLVDFITIYLLYRHKIETMISPGEAGRRTGTESPLLRLLWAGSTKKTEAQGSTQPPSLLGRLLGFACITAVALQLFLCSSYVIICASKCVLKWTPAGTETTLQETEGIQLYLLQPTVQ